jgi:hypothetical protein
VGEEGSQISKTAGEVILAGGLQDNGDIACKIALGFDIELILVSSNRPAESFLGPWRRFDGGDGGFTPVLNIDGFSGQRIAGDLTEQVEALIVHSNNPGASPPRHSTLLVDRSSSSAGYKFNWHGTVPVPGSQDETFTRIVFSAVAEPRWVDSDYYIVAVGGANTGKRGELWALALNQQGDAAWHLLWTFGGGISDAASYDGRHVYAGVGGSIFVVDAQKSLAGHGSADEQVVTAPPGHVDRFAIGNGVHHAIWGDNMIITDQSQLSPLHLGWHPLPAPKDDFFGLAVDPTTPGPTLYAAGERTIYSSADGGKTWQKDASGLPAGAACTDLRFLQDPLSDRRFLFLSTYGRSVWQAEIDPSRG